MILYQDYKNLIFQDPFFRFNMDINTKLTVSILNFTFLWQFIQNLLIQKGEGNIKNSQSLKTCLLQCGHSKPFNWYYLHQYLLHYLFDVPRPIIMIGS